MGSNAPLDFMSLQCTPLISTAPELIYLLLLYTFTTYRGNLPHYVSETVLVACISA